MLRVALCDDAVAFKAMAKLLLEGEGDLEVVAAFDDGASLRAGLDGLDADVLLLDLLLPDEPDTAALVAEVRRRAPRTAVVLCSGMPPAQLAELARGVPGVAGQVSKGQGAAGLRDAVRAATG